MGPRLKPWAETTKPTEGAGASLFSRLRPISPTALDGFSLGRTVVYPSMQKSVGVEEWENILETLTELHDPEYLDSIREARREIELGEVVTLEELAADATKGSGGAIHEGCVLGIDVGFSRNRKTTGLCLLSWRQDRISWRCQNTGRGEEERENALRSLVPRGTQLNAVAIDGPLTHGLQMSDHYRAAEALLSRGRFQKRGKPGQTSSKIGGHLHAHATRLAKLVIDLNEHGHFQLKRSPLKSIHPLAIYEAFPNAFLAVMLPNSALPELENVPRREKFDWLWQKAVVVGGITGLLESLLPNKSLANGLNAIEDHDHRAAFICAVTALAVSVGSFVAVGDATDGDIFLPPVSAWGAGDGTEPWAQTELRKNLQSVRKRGTHQNHQRARIIGDGQEWDP